MRAHSLLLKTVRFCVLCNEAVYSFSDITFTGKLYSCGMGGVHLGHVTNVDEGYQDHLVPKQVTSTRLVNSKFLSVAAGSSHMAVIHTPVDAANGN